MNTAAHLAALKDVNTKLMAVYNIGGELPADVTRQTAPLVLDQAADDLKKLIEQAQLALAAIEAYKA